MTETVSPHRSARRDRPRTGGPALFFVPGWCGDRDVFDPLLPGASGHRRAVSVDLPDHGDSPARADFTTGDVVDALVATIDALGIDTVVPVGLSHAGWAAIELRRRLGAERVPGRGADGLDGARHAARLRRRPRRPAVAGVGRRARRAHLDVARRSPHPGPAPTYVAAMKTYGQRHWSRAGREIAATFAAQPVPLAGSRGAPALPDAAPLRPAGRRRGAGRAAGVRRGAPVVRRRAARRAQPLPDVRGARGDGRGDRVVRRDGCG